MLKRFLKERTLYHVDRCSHKFLVRAECLSELQLCERYLRNLSTLSMGDRRVGLTRRCDPSIDCNRSLSMRQAEEY